MFGIVRRIDELGRIVIPKEMRKTMRLQVGDEMEILQNDEGLTLKKYSGFQSALPQCKAVVKALCETVQKDVLLINSSDVVAAEGANKKRYQNARLTDGFANRIRKRKEEILHGEELSGVFENLDVTENFLTIRPIVVGGDFLGALLVLSDDVLSQTDKAYLGFCAQLMSATFVQ